MLSRIFLRYVDRFGCDYHRLSATDLQCLFIIIDSRGGTCQYEIFKGTAKQPRVQRVQQEKRFRGFKGFRGEGGRAWGPRVMADFVGGLCRKGRRPFGPRVVVSPFRAMLMKSALRDFLPAGHCHPERSEGSR